MKGKRETIHEHVHWSATQQKIHVEVKLGVGVGSSNLLHNICLMSYQFRF